MIFKIRYLWSMILLGVFSTSTVMAEDWAGTVKSINGTVTVERSGKAIPVSVGDKVLPKDKLLSGKESSIGLTLRDDTLMSMGANSQLVLSEFSFDPATQNGSLLISVLRGVTAMVSGLVAKANPQAMRVTTPSSTIGIRGTEFIVVVEGE